MLLNTKPHEDILNGYQYSIRTGNRLPDNAVNLAYYYSKPLSPADNVMISDTSKFVLENVNQELDNQLILFPNALNILEMNGNSDLDSELFEITDKFYEGTPLYYCYKLYFKHFDKVGPNNLGEYFGENIYLIGMNNRPISKGRYPYSIYLKPTGNSNTYTIYIYTAFLLKNENVMRCVYNAIVDKTINGILQHDIMPAYEERINPQLFFNGYTLLNGSVGSVNTKKIKIDTVPLITDTRQKVPFSFKVTTSDGLISSNPIATAAVNSLYAMTHEKALFLGKNMIVSPKDNEGKLMTCKEIILKDNPNADLTGKLFIVIFNTDTVTVTNRKFINLSTDPDGNGSVVAETSKETGAPDNLGGFSNKIDAPNLYKIAGVNIVPAYGVKKKDHRQIMIKLPTQSEVFDNWYPRIQYGRFDKTTSIEGGRVKHYYTVPEYNREDYSLIYKKPYIDIARETPTVLNSKTLKTKFFPLYVKLLEDKYPINLKVTKLNAYGDRINLSITAWNCLDGVIELDNPIKDNDNIWIDYTFEEQSYDYRGYVDESVEDFLNMDLNPLQYHTIKMMNEGKYHDVPTYYLFNNIIYIYMKPVAESLVNEDNSETVNSEFEVPLNAIYHSFDETSTGEYDILLGKIYVRHNATLDAVRLTDARVRGGGVLSDMYEPLRRQLEPESDYYWDIGYWDGEPYSENAVLIIRMDKRILKDYGGRFTPQDVDKAVNKYIAYGVLPVIEYVSTYSKENSINQSLRIEGTYSNKIKLVPSATFDIYNQVIVPAITIDSIYQSRKPCGIIKITSEKVPSDLIYGTTYITNYRIDYPDVIVTAVRKFVKQPGMFLSVVDQ